MLRPTSHQTTSETTPKADHLPSGEHLSNHDTCFSTCWNPWNPWNWALKHVFQHVETHETSSSGLPTSSNFNKGSLPQPNIFRQATGWNLGTSMPRSSSEALAMGTWGLAATNTRLAHTFLGKLTHNYGKIHHAINGKIHYKLPFSIAMLVYQRVNVLFECGTCHIESKVSIWHSQKSKTRWIDPEPNHPNHRLNGISRSDWIAELNCCMHNRECQGRKNWKHTSMF